MNLLQAANVQRHVVGALVMRELHTRYGRDDFGFLWFLLEPLIFMLGVVVMWRLIRGGYDHNLPVIPMVFMGYPPLLLWRHIISRAMACIQPNVGLLYHRRVTVLDLFISRVIIEVAGNLAALFLCFWVLYGMGLLDWPANLPLMYLGYFYMTFFAVGMALTMSALSERTEIVEKIWTPMMYLSNPLTGALAMAQWLPANIRHYYLWVPTVHAFELIRAGYFGDSVQNYGSQSYIAAWSAGFTLLGLWLFRDVRKHVVME